MRRFLQRSWKAWALATVLSLPAQAAPLEAGPSITVHVTSADLATDPAIESLRAKLKKAAREVCKAELRNDAIQIYGHACYSGTFKDAAAQLNKLRARDSATFGGASIVILAR